MAKIIILWMKIIPSNVHMFKNGINCNRQCLIFLIYLKTTLYLHGYSTCYIINSIIYLKAFHIFIKIEL